MTVDIAELRRLLATATPGPWWLSASRVAVISADSVLVCSVNRITPQTDLELIAAAVNALPQLLDEVEAAMAYADATREGDVVYPGCVRKHMDAQLALYDAVDAARKERT